MSKTDIEYLDYTWNPIAMRCTPVSEGCRNCWHIRMAKRLAHNPSCDGFRQDIYSGKIAGYVLNESQFEAPMRKKKPARIGVQFMGDIFHEFNTFRLIHEIWDIMKACPQHTFIVLTKRPGRMKEVLEKIYSMERFGSALGFWRHVHLGVSVEDQATADERIPILLQTPAEVRFVSVEPMLGLVNMERHLWYTGDNGDLYDEYTGGFREGDPYEPGPGIHWVICGGETGPGARPMHPDWPRSLRDQCIKAGVPFFMKQMSKKESIPEDLMIREMPR